MPHTTINDQTVKKVSNTPNLPVIIKPSHPHKSSSPIQIQRMKLLQKSTRMTTDETRIDVGKTLGQMLWPSMIQSNKNPKDLSSKTHNPLFGTARLGFGCMCVRHLGWKICHLCWVWWSKRRIVHWITDKRPTNKKRPFLVSHGTREKLIGRSRSYWWMLSASPIDKRIKNTQTRKLWERLFSFCLKKKTRYEIISNQMSLTCVITSGKDCKKRKAWSVLALTDLSTNQNHWMWAFWKLVIAVWGLFCSKGKT